MLLLPSNLVCLALILASFFDKNVAYNEDRLMATIQQNLIYALFPGDEFPQTRYKFDESIGFEDWRIGQLVNIAEIDNTGIPRGSTQSNDVLMHDEWIYLQNTGNSGAFNGVFYNAVANLLHKVRLFTSNNDNINFCDHNNVKNDLEKYDSIQKETKKALQEAPEKRKEILSRRKIWLTEICQCFTPSTSSHHSSPHHFYHETSPPHSKNRCEEIIELVIRCKVFIRDLYSEGGEGSLIDIFSFMESDPNMKDLKKIFELSKIQTKKLDQAINERIYEGHREKLKNMHSVVQGAGPVGLYATYKLFMEGVNVTLVNDRSEEYTRNRVVFFDRKWMSQLRFFLGTEFDKLFDKEGKSLGSLLNEDIGFVNMKNMETFLKERLKNLSKYISKREEKQGNQHEKSFLNLIYNTAVSNIYTDYYVKPLAILGAPEKRRELFNFNHVRKMLTNYEGITISESDEIIGIPFDLFFCAGGARDHIRTNFLEPPQQLTESKNYGVVIFNKMNPSIKVFEDSVAFYRDHMDHMREHLMKQNIDGLIWQSGFLSYEFKTKYEYLTEMILQDKQIVVRLFESNPTLHIASITPRALVDLFDDLQIEKGNNEDLKEYYDNFHEELQKRWGKALFSYTFSTRHPERLEEVVIEGDEHVGSSSTSYRGKEIVQEPEQVLYFDPHRANTSTFYVAIYGIENPVRELHGTQDSAIIAAIGDANTSAHFMTASGVSTGKFLIRKNL